MTAPVSIPNRPVGSDTRSIAAILADFDAILDVFNNRQVEPGQHLKAGTSGQHLIADASGFWTPRAITGDITIDNTGVATIGAGKVTHTFRTGHTFAVQGGIVVPSGGTDYLPPFFVPKAPNQTVKLIACRYVIRAGTSVTFKLQRNLVDATGFTGLSATTTATTTDPADITLADGDYIQPIVTAVAGAPDNLSLTIYLEHSVVN